MISSPTRREGERTDVGRVSYTPFDGIGLTTAVLALILRGSTLFTDRRTPGRQTQARTDRRS
jgi:dihydroorotase-like cyclic amidohydrolase